MLAKEPEARYQSAGELIEALLNICHTLPSEHETLVSRMSRRIVGLQTKPTATVRRSFWLSDAFRSAVAQLFLALLISWMLPRTGSSLPQFPELKLSGAKIDAWQPLRNPMCELGGGRQALNLAWNHQLDEENVVVTRRVKPQASKAALRALPDSTALQTIFKICSIQLSSAQLDLFWTTFPQSWILQLCASESS